MIYFFLPERRLARLSARHYGIVFVTLDIIAFLVQLGGASLTSNTDNETKTVLLGLHIYMGGIGMQEFFILCFLGLAIQMHRVMLRMEAQGQIGAEKLHRRRFSWRWLFYSMYFALSMITVRKTQPPFLSCFSFMPKTRDINLNPSDPDHLPSCSIRTRYIRN